MTTLDSFAARHDAPHNRPPATPPRPRPQATRAVLLRRLALETGRGGKSDCCPRFETDSSEARPHPAAGHPSFHPALHARTGPSAVHLARSGLDRPRTPRRSRPSGPRHAPCDAHGPSGRAPATDRPALRPGSPAAASPRDQGTP